jgi:hypothetical protein
MPPELAAGREDGVTPAADVFGLGAILYYLLTGRPPYQGGSTPEVLRQAQRARPDPPRRVNPKVPAALDRICRRALSADPGDRHPTAAALAEDLRRYLDRPRRLRRWLAGAAAAAVPAVAVVLLFLVRPARQAEPPRPLQDDRLVLWIWSKDGSKKGLRIGVDPGALPARAGDQIRVEVRLNQPAHVYLLALGAQGGVTPLYPWHRDAGHLDGTVDDPPPAVPPQSEVVWPTMESELGLPLDDRDGLETVLLLARREPFASSLAGLIGPLPLPPAPLRHDQEFALRGGDPGQAIDAIRLDAHRGFQKDLAEIDEPLEKLLARLRPQFELLRAVRFAHRGR